MLCQAVLVYCALALPKDVVDFSNIDVAPDFGPLGIKISTQSCAESVCRRLIILLVEHRFRQTEVRQRITGLIIQSLLILLNRFVVFALFRVSFTASN